MGEREVNVGDVARGIIYYTLLVFWLLLLTRMLTELARLAVRSWTPTGWAAGGLEVVYTATDPPYDCCARWSRTSGSAGLVWICR